ncbi:transporter, NhaC family (TC 2.A.35) [Peptoclostridium litorale DSM 5388]|uniref:Na(+)/H(+) antiporter NhaC n=1 Tax=Peptoclostridium litorale DSM 5388 TaxID=1121324 RepID=A0A069RHG9_PEPLI|nr:Na+/H+ antiporter NhaC [Peptoclostridium litorale]KDR96489.1 Na(+)/H(+) antiporter NhaC [Peptoclostridium litorale DSM 5388]SIN69992.1 transporter, NhaC family (TC 2.A.35) [Peptoclostridium litorale DSM 5388]
MENDTKIKMPTIIFALFTVLLIVTTLMGGLLAFHADMHILLFICIVIAASASKLLGHSWECIEKSMINGVSRAMGALFFFFLIGMAIGAWVQSGTVPALIYYGLDIMSYRFFLPAGLIICTLSSMAIGSSWNTAGTVGVALMGVGVGMGIPAPLVAGMVISGSYFGDKMSPLSETTNLSPAIAGSSLYEHIRAMLYTSIPAYMCALAAYGTMGLKYAHTSPDMKHIGQIQYAIGSSFNLHVIVFLPLIVVMGLSIARFPAIPSLVTGIVVSLPISIVVQKRGVVESLGVLNYGFSAQSGVEVVDILLNRGGIQSMMWTFSLAIMALSLGGILAQSNIMDVIIEKVLQKVKNPKYLPGMTIMTAVFINATMGEQYMGIVLTGELYKEAYPKANLQPRMLSRALEEGATLTSSLFPWTTGGAFMSTALGISAFQYAPYAIVNWLNPIFGILFPVLGYSLLTMNSSKGKISIKEYAQQNHAKADEILK